MISKIREELQFLRDAGQKEYARNEDDAFGNFRRISDMTDGTVSMDRVLLIYAYKHVDGIRAYVDGHKSQREDVKGRANDLIVYLVLLLAMYRTGYKANRAQVAEVLDEMLDLYEAEDGYGRDVGVEELLSDQEYDVACLLRGEFRSEAIASIVYAAIALRHRLELES